MRSSVARAKAVALAVTLAILGSGIAGPVAAGVGPAQIGQFEVIDPGFALTPVHAALLRTGKVWLSSGSANSRRIFNEGLFRSYVWNPADGSLKELAAPWDLFCAGQTFLPGGRLLIAGGTQGFPAEPPGQPNQFQGSRRAYAFDPINEVYQTMPMMAGGRWYPTLVTMGNGSVYAMGGISETGTSMNDTPEVLKRGSSAWRSRPRMDPWPTYPHLFLTKGGRLFYSGGNVFPSIFGVELPPPGFLATRTSKLTPVPGLSQPISRDQSASVLLPPAQSQRVMIMGGGAMGTGATNDNVDIIDLQKPDPHYVRGPDLIHPRMHLNAVLLPDRTVLVTGGGSIRESDPVLESEIFDPRTNSWSVAATSDIPRLYHSFGLLLPDGRVLLGGSQPPDVPAEKRLELYSPPYLFAGTRPVISQAPSQVRYGATIRINTTQATTIKWVSLIRPSAVTHSADSEQRVVDVPSRRVAAGVLELTVTGDPTIAPPGWYMLFVTNDDGVPSVAKWIKVG